MKEAAKTVPVKNIDEYLATTPQNEGSTVRASQDFSGRCPDDKRKHPLPDAGGYRTTVPLLTMGETLQPFIFPRQNKNRS